MTSSGEFRALTGARGVAAWMVVLFHVTPSLAGAPRWLAHLSAKGYLSVDFFFLLSGFVIWLSWGDRLHAEGWRSVGPFLHKRIARIWPLHIVMLAATVAIALSAAAMGRADPRAFPFADLPQHVLLLQNWGFTDRLAWNVPSWSISAELGAYLVFPIIAILIDQRRLSPRALVAIAGILIVGLCVAIGASPTLSFDITRFGLIRCLCEFLTGSIACMLWQRGQGVRIAGFLAVAITALWMVGLPETLAAPALFATIIYLLAATSRSNPLSRNAPHFLGEISYATYLCHYPLWLAFTLFFARSPNDVPPVLIAIYAGVVVMSSMLLYRHVERPAQRWFGSLGKSPTLACALP